MDTTPSEKLKMIICKDKTIIVLITTVLQESLHINIYRYAAALNFTGRPLARSD